MAADPPSRAPPSQPQAPRASPTAAPSPAAAAAAAPACRTPTSRLQLHNLGAVNAHGPLSNPAINVASRPPRSNPSPTAQAPTSTPRPLSKPAAATTKNQDVRDRKSVV
jgi:hypothetical protein